MFIKQYRRFHKEYCRELWKRLKKLEEISWDLKIELTIDPKRFLWLYDEFVWITRAWHEPRRWIVKKYGSFVFLRILEFQKSGRPHLHILIKGVSYISQKKLSEMWVKYGGGYVWIRKILPNGRINAIRYVLKYVTKFLASNDVRYGALLFASNKRLYSISSGLKIYLWRRKKSDNVRYVYDGVVLASEVKDYCEEIGKKN